jgi:hypothetical protein
VTGGPSSGSGVSIFYANELARIGMELAESRLQAREFECALRELQWKYNVDKYRLQAKVSSLEKQGFHQKGAESAANTQPITLTYVRNVLLRFISTKDKNQKQVMINALLTALNATEKEKA